MTTADVSFLLSLPKPGRQILFRALQKMSSTVRKQTRRTYRDICCPRTDPVQRLRQCKLVLRRVFLLQTRQRKCRSGFPDRPCRMHLLPRSPSWSYRSCSSTTTVSMIIAPTTWVPTHFDQIADRKVSLETFVDLPQSVNNDMHATIEKHTAS